MGPIDVDQLVSSFDEIAPRMEQLAQRFYGRLFTENPSLRPYFPLSTSLRRHRLLTSLSRVVHNLRQHHPMATVLSELEQAGPLHPTGEQRAIVRETLIDAMAEVTADSWTTDRSRSWREALIGAEKNVDGMSPRAA
jgi:hemoglobin-like flavoprotein